MTDELPKEQTDKEAVLLTFANDKSPENLATLRGLLKMVYHAVLTNKIAIMQAKNAQTGNEELVLVGVEQSGDSINCYPLFTPIRAEEVGKYIAPDGNGGWIEPPQVEE